MFLLSDFLLLTTPSKSVASHTSLAALERALTSLSCTMYRKVRYGVTLYNKILLMIDTRTVFLFCVDVLLCWITIIHDSEVNLTFQI